MRWTAASEKDPANATLEKNLVLRARPAVEVLEQSVVLGSEGIVVLDRVDESHRVTLHRRE